MLVGEILMKYISLYFQLFLSIAISHRILVFSRDPFFNAYLPILDQTVVSGKVFLGILSHQTLGDFTF